MVVLENRQPSSMVTRQRYTTLPCQGQFYSLARFVLIVLIHLIPSDACFTGRVSYLQQRQKMVLRKSILSVRMALNQSPIKLIEL